MQVEVPKEVHVEVKGVQVLTKGSLGTNSRNFNDALLSVTSEGSRLVITPSTSRALKKKASMAARALAKELGNDIAGVAKHYEVNMQVIFAHFPATVEAKGKEVVIKNLIGERGVRKIELSGDTKIEVKGQNLRLYGTKLDDVAQSAANLRKACKIRKKDERVFQDGIYYSVE